MNRFVDYLYGYLKKLSPNTVVTSTSLIKVIEEYYQEEKRLDDAQNEFIGHDI